MDELISMCSNDALDLPVLERIPRGTPAEMSQAPNVASTLLQQPPTASGGEIGTHRHILLPDAVRLLCKLRWNRIFRQGLRVH